MRPVVAFPLVAFELVACGGSGAPPAGPPAPPPAAPPVAAPAPAVVAPARSPSAPGRRAPADLEPIPDTVVQLSFEPLVTGVRPGSRFLLAAHLRILPGYRISWKIPGEVGQKTEITFRAPPGFAVGPVQFPAPERYSVPSGFVGYGYTKETALFVEITAPGSLRSSDVHRFDVEGSWVACKKQCASERTSAFVELVTTHGQARAADTEAELAPFLAQLPQPLSGLSNAEQTWEITEQDATLVVRLPGAVPLDFFQEGVANPAPTKTTMSDGELRFGYDEAPRPGSRPLRGVIVASVGGKNTAFDLEAVLPLTEEERKEKEKKEAKPAVPGRRGRPGKAR